MPNIIAGGWQDGTFPLSLLHFVMKKRILKTSLASLLVLSLIVGTISMPAFAKSVSYFGPPSLKDKAISFEKCMPWLYDSLISMVYNGTEYWYIRNAQNDVIGLFDANGNTVVQYVYNSWGCR